MHCTPPSRMSSSSNEGRARDVGRALGPWSWARFDRRVDAGRIDPGAPARARQERDLEAQAAAALQLVPALEEEAGQRPADVAEPEKAKVKLFHISI